MPRKCSVKDCTADVKHKFKFPQANTDKKRLLKWLAASGNSSLLSLSTHQLRMKGICTRHFEPKYMLAKKLANTAVPTLHLPDEIDVSTYNTEDNNNSESEPPKQLSNDNTTYFRAESDLETILRQEKRSPDDIVFDGTARDSPVEEILSAVHFDGKQVCAQQSIQNSNPTLPEESVNSAELQAIPGHTMDRKTQSITSTVRKNERKKVNEICILYKPFVKAGMEMHLVKLHQALEENSLEHTKYFIRNQLQALITAIFNRMT